MAPGTNQRKETWSPQTFGSVSDPSLEVKEESLDEFHVDLWGLKPSTHLTHAHSKLSPGLKAETEEGEILPPPNTARIVPKLAQRPVKYMEESPEQITSVPLYGSFRPESPPLTPGSSKCRKWMPYDTVPRAFTSGCGPGTPSTLKRSTFHGIQDLQRSLPKALAEAEILRAYGPSNRRLFLFDYDGTLTPIVNDPSSAKLCNGTRRALQVLALNAKNAVYVISGRNRDFLEEQFQDNSHIGLVAEHGAFVRWPELDEWRGVMEDLDMNWKQYVIKIFSYFTQLVPGSSIEVKKTCVVWHFRSCDPVLAAAEVIRCKDHFRDSDAGEWPLTFVDGKCVLEVRHEAINKGGSVELLVHEHQDQYGSLPSFVFCAGDDTTDEDMFAAVRAIGMPENTAFTVLVSERPRQTCAEWMSEDPTAVLATINMLNESDNDSDVEGKGPLMVDGSFRGSKPFPVPRSDLL